MSVIREKALYLQVVDGLKSGLLKTTPAGECLPSDKVLSEQWQVSVRTVREALLVLESEGLVQRQQGRGTVVCKPERPIALYCELNLLHAQTARFYGIVLDIIRDRLKQQGYSSRLYTGRSISGDVSHQFSCPELIADAQAGRLGGILALATEFRTPALRRLRQEGLPMLCSDEEACPLNGPTHFMTTGVDYLASIGRKRIGLIAWDAVPTNGNGEIMSLFEEILTERGLAFSSERCRTDLSFASGGAGWEEFREIWFGPLEKPDALLVGDENYLPEVIMAVMQLGIRVPQDLLIVSHRTRHVQWASPVPVAYAEENVDLFAQVLADRLLARIEGSPEPELPLHETMFQLFPVHGIEAVQAEPTQYKQEKMHSQNVS